MSSDVQHGEVPSMIKNLSQVVWLRTEFQGRWDLVVDREQQAEILGTKPSLVSSRHSNYPEHFPKAVVKYGTRKWVLRSEMEEFARWLEGARAESSGKNQGARVQRTVKEKATSEIVRLTARLEMLEQQKADAVRTVRAKAAEITRVKARIVAQEQLRETTTR